MKRILVLGATGNTGNLVAKYLLELTECKITLGARNEGRLIELLNELRSDENRYRLDYTIVDARSNESLRKSFNAVDLVIVCSPSLNVFRNIIDIAVESAIDYFDINISAAKNEYLRSRESEIIEKGLCFVTDGGFHPGVPAALVEYASGRFDKLIKANVYGLMKMNWGDYDFSKETVLEMVDEMKDFKTTVFRNGAWTSVKFSDYPKVLFPEPFGKVSCYPMHLDEMMTLPAKHPSLQETGFYVSGFNSIVDNLFLPFAFVALKIFGSYTLKPVASLFQWCLKRFSKPPYTIMLRLEAEGLKEGELSKYSLSLEHRDGYEMTAIPMIAFLLQYIEGLSRKSGVHLQANIVQPVKFIATLSELGIEIIEN